MEKKFEEKPSVAICGGSVFIFAGLRPFPEEGVHAS